MKFNDEMIGARLIESITSGLYDGNLNCIREYVQNGIDSKAKKIEISFENGNDLVIKDDGLGMDKAGLADALHIGKSNKSKGNVGWRGIGIWSGVPSSQRLVIITKPMGLDKKYRIEIENGKLRSTYSSNLSAVKVLTEATGEIEEIDYGLGKNESIDDHFTIIRLEGILPTQKQFFTPKEIRDYLSQVVPTPLNKDKFSFATEIDDWLSGNNIIFSNFVISFEGEEILRGPTDSDLFIKALSLKEFRSEDDTLIAVGWFLATKENKKEAWPNGGILFKKKGFTIGDENLINRYYDKTLHQWFCGEIHVISDEIRENAARNNFEYDYGKVDEFFNYISDYAKDLDKANHYKSSLGQIKKVEKIANLVDVGKTSEAKLELEKLNKSLSQKRSFPTDTSLQVLKSAIDSEFKEKKKDLIELNSKFGIPTESSLFESDPSESAPSENAPSESAPSESAPSENAPSENAPSENAHSKNAHSENTHSENVPLESGKDVKRSNGLTESREYFDVIKRSLPEPVKKRISRVKSGYEKDIVISATDALEEILKKKTGETTPKFVDLTKKAFGWENVTGNEGCLILDKENKAKNRQFGVAVYIIYDLFVNKFKHERGTNNFEWFEKASEEEKTKIIAEMYATIGLLYRLIEKSDKL